MSLHSILEPHRRWMQLALKEAERAYEEDEVPVGAVVVQNNVLIGRGHNQVERLKDPTAHAEILAISAACETLGSKYLEGCTMYVTLEPCPMCAGAVVMARIGTLIFGAFDEKAGACATLFSIPQDTRLNHHVEIVSGVDADLAAALLTRFFKERRVGASGDGR